MVGRPRNGTLSKARFWGNKRWYLVSKVWKKKTVFLIGALIASLALIAMPFSSSIWMAASLLWILDAANNIALEPYRAFV